MNTSSGSERFREETKPCENCRGSGEVNRVIFGEQPETLRIFGKKLPLIGSILIEECSDCGGTGERSTEADFSRFRQAGENVTDDSRVPVRVPHTRDEILRFISRLTDNRESIPEQSQPIDTEVIVLPVNHNFHASGELFKAFAWKISAQGIGLEHAEPIPSNFLLMQLVTADFETRQIAVRVMQTEQSQRAWRSWCEFVIA